ncbi:MAG: 4,5-DOPA dioxygenase extradiol [Nitrospina sp.]|nr:4,5-DOPA dioxygenase extradiol [Nitrospina sp.]
MNTADNKPMPALFLGHGSPMNVIEHNRFSSSWKILGRCLPRPRAILCVSAHWVTAGTRVTAMEMPRTVHDFANFPQALYDIQYPAPGSPALAKRIQSQTRLTRIDLEFDRGLDHGTWGVLAPMYPAADIPVLQFSLDGGLPPKTHFAIGQELRWLRDEGVLILGSGNIVHNLGRLDPAAEAEPADWAVEFDEAVKQCLLEGDHQKILDYESLGEIARLSVPTPEHFLPLLYIMALQREEERVTFPVEGIAHQGISMRSVMIS